MPADVVVAADAGPGSGLGHLSRSGAVAAALRARGLDVECFGLGAATDVRHGAIRWSAAASLDAVPPVRPGGLVVLDSYAVSAARARDRLTPGALAVMHARGLDAPVDVVVTPIPRQPPPGAALVLSGLEYACLRPEFWGLAPSPPAGELPLRVLVTAGADAHHEAEAGVDAVLQGATGVRVSVVGGPGPGARDDVEFLGSPPSLLPALGAADIVVTAAGQTALESLAAGRCTVVFVVADNQVRQARYLAQRGLVRLARGPEEMGREVTRLAADPKLRDELARVGAAAVDGFGALRVSSRLASILRADDEVRARGTPA